MRLTTLTGTYQTNKTNQVQNRKKVSVSYLFVGLHGDELPLGLQVAAQAGQRLRLVLLEHVALAVALAPLAQVHGILHVVGVRGWRRGRAAGRPARHAARRPARRAARRSAAILPRPVVRRLKTINANQYETGL